MKNYDLIIVGAGPAGLAAGIFAARQKMSVLILSKDLGGQVNLIPRLENYPGMIMSSGPILAKTLENQYLGLNGEISYDVVEQIEQVQNGFEVKTARSQYNATSIIIAAGKVPNDLGLDNEKHYINRGVHYCSKCDAPYYQGKITASVGVGTYLLESGLLLSKMVEKSYLIFRGKSLGGEKEIIEKIKSQKNVELVPNSTIKKIIGNGTVKQILVRTKDDIEKTLDVDGLFVEMGAKINLDFVNGLVKTNAKGEIIVLPGGLTSNKAIFAAGDVTDTPYKQIIAACGEGAAAGLSAFNYVERQKGRFGTKADWKKQIGTTVFNY